MNNHQFHAAWVSEACAADLKAKFNITKQLHLTLYYDQYGKLDLVSPANMSEYTSKDALYGTVVTIHEQQVGDTRLLVAELDTQWSYSMNNYYSECCGMERLPHRSHVTLAKGIQPGYSMAFSGLVGYRIEFDRIGPEV